MKRFRRAFPDFSLTKHRGQARGMRSYKNESDKGMVIVEASIVFPVMFLVIFLLIFLGNAYMQKCRIEAIVGDLTMKGAAYCASPMLFSLEMGGGIPDFGSVEVKPYRYFLGGMNDVEDWVTGELGEKISGMSTGLFSGMKPHNWEANVKFDNKFIYSSFKIDLNYKITVPVRLLGASDFFQLKVATHSEMAVSDTTEFIRNVDLVEDYMESTGLKDKITEMIAKVKEWL